jgi:hypothetical protein
MLRVRLRNRAERTSCRRWKSADCVRGKLENKFARCSGEGKHQTRNRLSASWRGGDGIKGCRLSRIPEFPSLMKDSGALDPSTRLVNMNNL